MLDVLFLSLTLALFALVGLIGEARLTEERADPCARAVAAPHGRIG